MKNAKFRVPFFNYKEKFLGFDELDPIKGLEAYNAGRCHRGEIEIFTGHKDRKGTDVYEGDFLKKGNALGYVFWCEEDACFRVCFLPMKTYANLWEIETKEYCEVVGNIHKNPELMPEVVK